MVVAVADVDVACAIDGDTVGSVEAGLRGGAAVSGEGESSVPGDGGDDAVGAYFADAAVVEIRDEELAFVVDGNRGGINGGVAGLATIPAKTRRPFPA